MCVIWMVRPLELDRWFFVEFCVCGEHGAAAGTRTILGAGSGRKIHAGSNPHGFKLESDFQIHDCGIRLILVKLH